MPKQDKVTTQKKKPASPRTRARRATPARKAANTSAAAAPQGRSAKARKAPTTSGQTRRRSDEVVGRAGATRVVAPAVTDEIARPEPTVGAETAAPSFEQIAWRAYQIYLSRNQEPGDAFTDWVRAKAELEATAG